MAHPSTNPLSRKNFNSGNSGSTAGMLRFAFFFDADAVADDADADADASNSSI
jgi:hypothetical protein